MPKNIPGIVKRSRRWQGEKVRILIQPNPYPLEQPGGQPNVSEPMNPSMQQGMQPAGPAVHQPMQPNGYGPMNPPMQQGGYGPMNPPMQQGGYGPMNPPMQPNGYSPTNPPMQQGMQPVSPMQQPMNTPQMQQGGPASMTPLSAPAPEQVVPLQSNGQWHGDPNARPQQQGYNNQLAAPMPPPQVQRPSTNPLPYNNSAAMQQGRSTPPPANNVPSRPLAQPGQTPEPQYSPQRLQPNPSLSNAQYSPVAAVPQPVAAPRTPSNSGLLGRPSSLSGIAGAPTLSAPTPHIFVEIDGKMVQEVRLDRPVLTVGRQDGRDIQIKHQSVSRTHARLVSENGTWFVEDAGSVNGIVFNGQRVQRAAINNGDRVFVSPNIALLYKIM